MGMPLIGRTEQDARNDLYRMLAELRTDYVDIGLLHRARPGALKMHRPALDLFIRAKEEGLVRGIGLSTDSPEIAMACIEIPER